MPCIPIPKLALPSVPTGINLSPTLPTFNPPGIPNFCCLTPPRIPPFPPLPLPPLVVNPAFVATIEAAIEAAESYIASLEPECPRQ